MVSTMGTFSSRAAQQGALDLETRVVARVAGAAVLVRAEEALADPSVRLAREGHAPALEILDAAGGVLGDDLDDRGIAEEVRLAQRVCGVLLPAVLRIDRAERGVDAAGGERGVRVVLATLADREHLHPALGELDRGAEAGAPGTDDQHGGGEEALAGGGVVARRDGACCIRVHADHVRHPRLITPMNSPDHDDAIML
jgi:hypothetical protein